MKVVLMGLEFFINNLGCEALSYSFVSELYEIVRKKEEPLEVKTIVFADRKTPFIPGTDIPVKCIGIHYKKIGFWKEIKREFKEADYIFDFTMGDSFSDIYGMKRFSLDALVKMCAIKSGTPYILGPQTYGPYKNRIAKSLAKWILKRAAKVYTRDEQSQKLAEQLSGKEVYLTTDVAFALPYEKKSVGTENKIKVGINPSGLLYSGGYTGNNQFGLTVDYQKYIWDVCEKLAGKEEYEVFLIPHVGTNTNSENEVESDGYICNEIKKKYPAMHLVSDIETPMDAKGYIAAMDIFIGTRMHATIGAFSSGVATIPVSYSRKFEGLYESLNYPYLIHAREESTETAIENTLLWIERHDELKACVADSLALVQEKQKFFRESLLKDIFKKDFCQ